MDATFLVATPCRVIEFFMPPHGQKYSTTRTGRHESLNSFETPVSSGETGPPFGQE